MASSKLNKNTIFDVSPSKVVNTDFLDEHSEQTENTLGRGQSLLDPLAYQSIVDQKNLPIPELFKKPFLVDQRSWSTTDAAGFPLRSTSLNNFMQNSLAPSNTLLSTFAFFRSGFKFTLRINSSPFHSGKLALYYSPPFGLSTATPSVYQISGYPVSYADAGNSSVVTLEIPFISVQDFLNTSIADPTQNCGTISVTVFNPLRIGTGGPTTVGYSLWLEPLSPELSVPVRRHAVTLQSEDMPLTVPDLQLPSIDSLNSISSLLDQLPAIRGMFSSSLENPEGKGTFPKTAAPVKSNATIKETTYAGSAPSISNMNGHRTEHLSLVPEETKVTQSFSRMLGRDEQSLITISQIPQLLSQYQWSSADTANTNLGYFPVTPFSSHYVAPAAATAGYRDLPFCAYVSAPFSYWRGAINYRIVVASTQQHTGRMLATWIPGDYIRNQASVTLPAITIADLSLFPSVVFDLSENREFNVSIPYSTITPFKGIKEARITPPDSANLIDTYCNGVLYLRVLNPLRGPSTVSDTVDFNVFISTGTDFQIKGLNSTRLGSTGIPYITNGNVQLQSLDVALESSRTGMEEDKKNSLSVSKHNTPKDSDQGFNSDNYLPKLLSRYYPQLGFRFTVDPQSNRIFRVRQYPGLLGQTNPQQPDARTIVFSNLISYYSRIFCFWEGSINYFFLHNTTVNNPILATFTHNNLPSDDYTTVPATAIPNQDLNAYASVGAAFADETVDLAVATRYSHISNLRVNASVEITLPYRSLYRRSGLSKTGDPLAFPNAPGSLDILYSNPSTTAQQISVQIFQSLGEDFRFQYLVPVSRLYLPVAG